MADTTMVRAEAGSDLTKLGKRALIMGIAGSTYVVASNQWVDGMWQDASGMDNSRSAPLYRALLQLVVGLVLARVTWKYSKDAAIGFLAGGALQAMIRVMDDANIAPRLRDLVDGDQGDGTPRVTRPYVAPGTAPAPTSTTPARGLPGARSGGSLHDFEGWTTVGAAPLSAMLRPHG